jgi:uncharacterized protein
MRIVISGASGLVGTALAKELQDRGGTVARLVRPGHPQQPNDINWNPAVGQIDANPLEAVDAVVHLSGASIAGGRWTEKRKAELRNSRVDTTKLLLDTFASMKTRPRVFVAASAVGYYGSRGDEVLTERSSSGDDFLARLARDWEAESLRAETLGIRTVILRFGVVLAAQGGALPQMLRPFRFGVGGRLGDGRQWLSWITLSDLVAIISQAVVDERFGGVFNAVAPEPIRNADFTRLAAATLHRPALFPVPRFALRLLLGEMADGAVLASQRAVPVRLQELGYPFQFSTFEAALPAVLRSQT